MESAERGLMDDALGGESGCDAVQKDEDTQVDGEPRPAVVLLDQVLEALEYLLFGWGQDGNGHDHLHLC